MILNFLPSNFAKFAFYGISYVRNFTVRVWCSFTGAHKTLILSFTFHTQRCTFKIINIFSAAGFNKFDTIVVTYFIMFFSLFQHVQQCTPRCWGNKENSFKFVLFLFNQFPFFFSFSSTLLFLSKFLCLKKGLEPSFSFFISFSYFVTPLLN